MDLFGEQPEEIETKRKSKRQNGTVIRWWADAGEILSDTGEVLAVHQVDLQFHGTGQRILPVGYQCEFERCTGVQREPRACEVSRAAGRPWVFNSGEESTSSDPATRASAIFNEPKHKTHPNKLMKYLCILETDETLEKGTVKFFNAELHFACIEPDGKPGEELFCDASGFVKQGSYMCVRRGVRVEYTKGTNAAGETVATRCTGPNNEPINNKTERRYISMKRKLSAEQLEIRKKRKEYHTKIEIPPKPDIPEGKNPVCILYEFVRCCNPKKVVSFKLIDEKKRARSVRGVRTSFTMECRLDEQEISQGTATVKKLAKTYAAQLALDALSKQSEKFKVEIDRIRSCVPRRQLVPSVPKYRFKQKISVRPVTSAPLAIYPLSYSTGIGLAPYPAVKPSSPPIVDTPLVIATKPQVSYYSQAGYVQALAAQAQTYSQVAASAYGLAYAQYQAAHQAVASAIPTVNLEHSPPTYAPPKCLY